MLILWNPTREELLDAPVGEWVRVFFGDGTYYDNIRGKGCHISLTYLPTCQNRGQWFACLEVLINPADMEIDSNDGWNPGRYYFDQHRAIQEIEAWLQAWNQID
jgi:hypothetical protein